MCGIAGIFDLDGGRNIDRAVLEAMNQTQVHRGPDGCGYHVEPGVGFGHRRLAIIDLSGGAQPLFNEDETVVVTYNGEIYNFKALADELSGLGHVFRTRCDTEVIVHAWEEWGEDCVERFNGMFAFAIWDRNRQTLFLARDRLGIKPVYYGVSEDGFLIFSSELKALLAFPKLNRTILPQAIEDYLAFGYIPEPKTIFAKVFKLPPGHTIAVEVGRGLPAPRQYWDLPFERRPDQPEADIHAELVERLRASVERRMIAEVPLGAFLSGGVDSSAVVAMMAGINPKPVNTCSISFGERAFNEAPYAEKVAAQYGTSHEVEQVDPQDFSLIDKLVDLYDEPYADSSAMPTYRVCELARKKVIVALSGDGGDENFAGYRRHRWHAYEEMVRTRFPGILRRPLFGALGAVYPKADWAPKIFRAKSTFQALARDSLEGYLHSVSILDGGFRRKLISTSLERDLQGYRAIDVFKAHVEDAPVHDGVSLVQYLDFKTYLPGDILTKVDRASMAHSLEVRVPLLDHEFVSWVSGLDPALKLSGREGKYIFKKSLEPYLPSDILYRPKMGFAVPLANWFRGPLKDRVRDSLLGSSLRDTGFFDPEVVRHIVDQHQSGLRDHSPAIWALLMFEGFCRKTLN
ncbi:MAG: amidotransferase 1, exosortase A system-associated [Gammaproteobacteria bacterium]|nr:amidotransferase 1, exosortase A system-associated [Gammaproteobacteria bacterium]